MLEAVVAALHTKQQRTLEKRDPEGAVHDTLDTLSAVSNALLAV